jgi:hypothetical protein
MFPFAQDMAISVKSGGIKLEYAFCRDNVSILFRFYVFLFSSCYSFRSVYALLPRALCDLDKLEIEWKGFFVYVCSLPCVLCDLGKSEIEGKFVFFG